MPNGEGTERVPGRREPWTSQKRPKTNARMENRASLFDENEYFLILVYFPHDFVKLDILCETTGGRRNRVFKFQEYLKLFSG
jgi:hypothetical protein